VTEKIANTYIFCKNGGGADIESDQKENKSEQVLQISYVVAKFYANNRSMHGRRPFIVSNATL
jgi:hypothetical protein